MISPHHFHGMAFVCTATNHFRQHVVPGLPKTAVGVEDLFAKWTCHLRQRDGEMELKLAVMGMIKEFVSVEGN